jgi:hypothetical protein
MRLNNRVINLIAVILAVTGLLAFGGGGLAQASAVPAAQRVAQQHVIPQANCPPNCPKATWKIVKVGPGYYTDSSWRDCAQVAPTPGFKKSYSCSFTGGVSNTYSETIGLSVEGISASVGFSVTYSTSVTGGTTYTPNSEKARGEIEWASQYVTHKIYEDDYFEGTVIAKNTGYASRWNQPVSRFVPAGTSTSSTSGTFTKKHWKCKKTCP